MTSEASTAADQQSSSLWRNRDFILLWGGQTISTLGSTMSDIAFGILVYQITHSKSQVAFVASIRALPFLVLTLPAGALMDMWDRKRVMLLSDLGRAACLASIAFALLTGHLPLSQLYIVALAEGALATLYSIAALAGVTRVVPKAQLGRATSATYVSSNTVSLVGPLLGTSLFTLARALPFVADAFSYLVSVASLAWIRREFQGKQTRSERHNLHELAVQVATGFTWLWRQPVLRFQALAGCVLSLVLYPTTALVIVLTDRLHTPQASIGVVFTFGAIGGLVGGLVGPWFQRRLPFGLIMIAMFALLAVFFVCYIAAPNLIWLGIILAAISLVESIGSIANLTYRLAQTPDEYQGRVNSIHRFVGFGVGRPLGAALLGVLFIWIGLNASILVFSAVLALFAVATALYRPVHTASYP
ncbi:MAG: MFS transporter [Ktedonobacterales bacterium]